MHSVHVAVEVHDRAEIVGREADDAGGDVAEDEEVEALGNPFGCAFLGFDGHVCLGLCPALEFAIQSAGYLGSGDGVDEELGEAVAVSKAFGEGVAQFDPERGFPGSAA